LKKRGHKKAAATYAKEMGRTDASLHSAHDLAHVFAWYRSKKPQAGAAKDETATRAVTATAAAMIRAAAMVARPTVNSSNSSDDDDEGKRKIDMLT